MRWYYEGKIQSNSCFSSQSFFCYSSYMMKQLGHLTCVFPSLNFSLCTFVVQLNMLSEIHANWHLDKDTWLNSMSLTRKNRALLWGSVIREHRIWLLSFLMLAEGDTQAWILIQLMNESIQWGCKKAIFKFYNFLY